MIAVGKQWKSVGAVVLAIIGTVFALEGGYSDNPADPGGKTNHGVTEQVARANGYQGDMKALPKGFLAFGEVGLAGEVRPAPRGQERLKEAAKLGFSVAVVPKANAPKKPIEGLTIHAVERVEEAMNVVREMG